MIGSRILRIRVCCPMEVSGSIGSMKNIQNLSGFRVQINPIMHQYSTIRAIRTFSKNQHHISFLSFESVPSVFWQNPEHVYHHCVPIELVKLGDLKDEIIISMYSQICTVWKIRNSLSSKIFPVKSMFVQ